MYLADYHIHTHYSFDSEADIEEICQNALARGMDVHEYEVSDGVGDIIISKKTKPK